MSIDSEKEYPPAAEGQPDSPQTAGGANTSRTLRVFSNLRNLAARVGDYQVRNECCLIKNQVALAIIAYFKSFTKHAVILFQPDKELYLYCILRMIIPSRAKLITVDQILVKPGTSRLEKFKAAVKRRLHRKVDLFLLHQKDTEGLRHHYGLAPEKTRYIPYKINSFDKMNTFHISDEGYVLSGGRSRRDYDTFCRAMDGLPYPATILVPSEAESAYHGTFFGQISVPENVRIKHDDGSAPSWNRHVAGSRLMVLSISPDTISPSGVGTYLLAMAMGKCVIITDCPAVKDILEDGNQAIIVPKQDPIALREAIRRAWEDEDYRGRIAERGRAYAISLGGAERLNESIARTTLEFLQRSEVADRFGSVPGLR